MSKVVIFPESKHTEAEAYLAACDAYFAAHSEPGGTFGYIRPDYMGQHVVPYLGPGWTYDGSPFAEPAEMIPLRADGVVHDFAIWAPEE